MAIRHNKSQLVLPARHFRKGAVEQPNHFANEASSGKKAIAPCVAQLKDQMKYARRGTESAKNALAGALKYKDTSHGMLTPHTKLRKPTLRQIENLHDNFSSATSLPVLNANFMTNERGAQELSA